MSSIAAGEPANWKAQKMHNGPAGLTGWAVDGAPRQRIYRSVGASQQEDDT